MLSSPIKEEFLAGILLRGVTIHEALLHTCNHTASRAAKLLCHLELTRTANVRGVLSSLHNRITAPRRETTTSGRDARLESRDRLDEEGREASTGGRFSASLSSFTRRAFALHARTSERTAIALGRQSPLARMPLIRSSAELKVATRAPLAHVRSR